MKLLILGIDGGDERIVRAMPMPFLHSLLDTGEKLELKEDLWSRGWAEMLSGHAGRETGAFYSKPVMDGSHTFTQRFRSGDFTENPKIVPLWQAMASLGHSTGFMNVPSTFPAPKIRNGFFVSGAGGGLSQKGMGNIPEGVTYPGEINPLIQKNKYIFDIRLKSSGIRDIDIFFDSLPNMVNRRTSLYLELFQKYNPSMGFIAYMGLCRVQYFAMSEIEALIASKCQPANPVQKKIVDFYRQFDAEMCRLFEALNPRHFILTADHGQAPYLYNINVNAFLKKAGFLTETPQSHSVRKNIKNGLKTGLRAVISEAARYKLFQNRLNPSAPPKIVPEWSSTHAFGARYVPGIYINDSRFNGPVKPAEAENIVKRLIDIFNQSETTKKHGLKATPYRQCFPAAYCNALLPDIWIEHPDTYFFVEHGPFVDANRDYGPIKSLWQVTRDMFTGIKGSYPLVYHDSGLSDYINEKESNNLTAIYHMTLRSMA
ncbi:MAG: alkaline phosphatase family protein [Desulfobacteraceae bacterium]|nr:alkaline phosphatase family protein [Desulfobacteraceae bacterium]